MSRLEPTLEPERLVRRIEVITGDGGRRRWTVDEKARIVEETLAPGSIVSVVARRHGLTPQQLFAWRREARRRSAASADEFPGFVPAVIETVSPMQAARAPVSRRARRRSKLSGIELEIGGVEIRVGSDATPRAIAAVIRALKKLT